MTASAESGYPAPQGPGVVPPFTAPPTDRDNRSLLISLGVSALLLVVCCVGGLVGVGVLFAGGVQEAKAQAQSTVDQYLTALRRSDYRGAYQLLCQDLTEGESLSSYTRRSAQDPIREFTVGAVSDSGAALVVAADVRYATRGEQQREYLVQVTFGEYTVCGER